MRKLVTIVVVSLCAVVACMTAPAEASDQAALAACKQAVEAKVRNKHKKAERVSLIDDKTKVKEESKKETSVKGQGQFDKKGNTRKFSFRCTYDVKKQKVSDVSIETK